MEGIEIIRPPAASHPRKIPTEREKDSNFRKKVSMQLKKQWSQLVPMFDEIFILILTREEKQVLAYGKLMNV